VVYVLDGNWYAGMVAGMIRPMAWCGSTSDAIVAGIGYAEDKDPAEACCCSGLSMGTEVCAQKVATNPLFYRRTIKS
jgi:hypothetical protein